MLQNITRFRLGLLLALVGLGYAPFALAAADSLNTVAMTSLPRYVQIFGLVVGFVLTIVLARAVTQFGGMVGRALYGLLAGVVLHTLAFAVSIYAPTLGFTALATMFGHMILMTLAMILTVVAAMQFVRAAS